MCILVVNKGKAVSKDNMRSMWIQNPHGVGIMFTRKNQRIKIVEKWKSNKITDLKKFDAFYDNVYMRFFEDPTVENLCVHFRYRTDGDVCIENTHPYEFKDYMGQAVCAMHNGVMNDKYRGYSMINTFQTSDTFNFVHEYLDSNPNVYTFDSVSDREALTIENELGDSKLVTLTSNGVLCIFNYELGRVYQDNWYSNMRWTRLGNIGAQPKPQWTEWIK